MTNPSGRRIYENNEKSTTIIIALRRLTRLRRIRVIPRLYNVFTLLKLTRPLSTYDGAFLTIARCLLWDLMYWVVLRTRSNLTCAVTKRKSTNARIPKSIKIFLGKIAINILRRIRTIKIRTRITTRRGTLGASKIIISGSVIIIATKSEAIKVLETTMGIDLINSPIIPEAISNGKKAKTVVNVVVRMGMRKSRQTSSPVSNGVNLPDLKYEVIAEMTTIVSSTSNPRESNNENIDKKLREIPLYFMTVKLIKNVSGTANRETKACLAPKKINSTIKTRNVVMIKSLINSPNW